MQPDFQLQVLDNKGSPQKDITDTLRPRLVEIRTIDCAGYTSDYMEIVVDDDGGALKKKDLGARFALRMGYRGDLMVEVGEFTYDELELEGSPQRMRLVASAVDFLSSLKAATTKSWHDTTLGDIVTTIAKKHDYKPAIAPDLAATPIDHIDQTSESDLTFLTRLSQQYGATFKAIKGLFVFIQEGGNTSASGIEIPPLVLTPKEVTSWRVTHRGRQRYGAVKVGWYDYDAAKVQYVTIGTGEPVEELRKMYKSEREAEAAGKAHLRRRAQSGVVASISMPGPTGENAKRLITEGILRLDGFREGADNDYHITRVERTLSGSGYRVRIEANLQWEGYR